MYRYLFLDADGTLFDFDEAERRAIILMGEALDVAIEDFHLNAYQSANLACWKAFERGELDLDELKTARFVRFNEETGLTLDPKSASGVYESNLAHQGILYEQSIDVLDALKSRGYTLYFASNGLANVQRGRIAVANIAHYFEDFFISEEMGSQKPDIRYFEMMLEKTGLAARKEECLMVGDSLSSDIAGGIASGIDTLWINAHNHGSGSLNPTYTVTSLEEILPLLPSIH
jgi:YjjG family noncanonical pyrimidine nucleotidase